MALSARSPQVGHEVVAVLRRTAGAALGFTSSEKLLCILPNCSSKGTIGTRGGRPGFPGGVWREVLAQMLSWRIHVEEVNGQEVKAL